MNLSELIAQNINDNGSKLTNLALVKEMIGDGAGLEGTNYTFVRGNGTPTENAEEWNEVVLAAGYMPRYLGSSYGFPYQFQFKKGMTFYNEGDQKYYRVNSDMLAPNMDALLLNSTEVTEEEATNTRVTIIVAPGEYDPGSGYLGLLSGINLVSLTGEADVKVKKFDVCSTISPFSDSSVTHCHIKGIHFTSDDYVNPDESMVYEKCKHDYGFKLDTSDPDTEYTCEATYIDCEAGNNAWKGRRLGKYIRAKCGNNSFNKCLGYFEECEALDNSFMADKINPGDTNSPAKFIRCKANDFSFISNYDGAYFEECKAHDNSFSCGEGSSLFVRCEGNDNCFSAQTSSDAFRGTFISCNVTGDSFKGYNNGSIYFCTFSPGSTGSFPPICDYGSCVSCINGDGSVTNY